MGELPTVGWQGFLDIPDLVGSVGYLALAVVLGAVIALHPTIANTVDTRKEAGLASVYIMYALIGAIIGEIVHAYPVVAFVIFGLGGLMRFRTDTGSPRDTGRIIIVTLIGLTVGLTLPHFAVLATIVTWILIWVLEGHPIYALEVHEVPNGRIREAAVSYRAAFKTMNCAIISESRSFSKGRIEYVFRAPRGATSERLQKQLCDLVPMDVRGEFDWEVE